QPTVPPNVVTRPAASSRRGVGLQDDQRHGPRHPPPRPPRHRPHGDPGAPAPELDPPARPHVPRVPGREPLPDRALPRGRPCRGTDGGRPRAPPGGASTGDRAWPTPRPRPRSGPPHPASPPALLAR